MTYRTFRTYEGAVPAVAESIRRFGFKGAIVLRSHDDPTIVNGHTRVAALRSLGWTEMPDESVRFCDDLTDEEVRALRIADNKTGEIATWDKAKLKREVRSIGKIDMSRFGCDWKSRHEGFEHGQERLRSDGAYNLGLVSAADCDRRGWPHLRGRMCRPEGMLGFNYAKSASDAQKAGRACHFFIDDYQFERVWSNPGRVVPWLRGFACVLTPDFSLYMDMPAPMQAWNHYRSMAVGLVWERAGLTVVPTLSWAGPESYAFCFEGVPRRSTVAVSTVGVKGDPAALKVWRDGMAEAMRTLRPRRVLLYGGDVVFDFGEAEVVGYRNGVTERMARGRPSSCDGGG